MKLSARTVAVKFLTRLQQNGASLQQLDASIPDEMIPQDRAFVKNLTYGICRHYFSLLGIYEQLVSKPLKTKDSDVKTIILLGLYQLKYLDTPAHAATSQTVACTREIKKPWAKGLVNACLRNFIRNKEQLVNSKQNPSAQFDHPAWMIEKLKATYPKNWEEILRANNQQAPMTLRVNLEKNTRDQYLQNLIDTDLCAEACQFSQAGIRLEKATRVSELPGFSEGLVSVQDEAAQLCCQFLAPEDSMRVLDACAAPGGKTGHLAESAPSSEIIAVELEDKRALKIQENLSRLQIDNVEVKVAGAEDLSAWWDDKKFDRILLDVPCSGSGVIRRQPDIKIHRRPSDIEQLLPIQTAILESCWQTLKPGGRLLYSTCSIFTEENNQQVSAFLSRHADANLLKIDIAMTSATDIGLQVLPGQYGMDGFYYALMEKTPDSPV